MRIRPGLLLLFVIALVVAVLATAPIYQTGVARRFLDLEAFKAYLAKGGDRAFYQFVLTAFAVLAALAGYFIYRSSEEARQATKEIESLRNKSEQAYKVIRDILESQADPAATAKFPRSLEETDEERKARKLLAEGNLKELQEPGKRWLFG